MIRDDWLLVLLTVLAVARLTRLVTADRIAEPFRDWIINWRMRRYPEPDPYLENDWVIYLIGCRWCASFWLAIPTVAVVYAWHSQAVVQVGLIALAASHVTALLAGLED